MLNYHRDLSGDFWMLNYHRDLSGDLWMLSCHRILFGDLWMPKYHRDLSEDPWMLSCLGLNIMVSIEWCRNQDPTIPRSWTNNSQGWSMHEQRSEMDLVSSTEKPTLPRCFSHVVFQKKTWEEEPGMATENWGWETNFPEKEILRGIRRNLFFLSVSQPKSQFLITWVRLSRSHPIKNTGLRVGD